jgi:hypothetical protein
MAPPTLAALDEYLRRLDEGVYTESGLTQVSSLRLPEYDFEIMPKDLFE